MCLRPTVLSSKLFLRGRAAPDSIETDVETATSLIVDSTKGFAGNVVLQIKYASGRFGWVEDMEKRPQGKGVATYSSVIHSARGVCVIRLALDVYLAVAGGTARENQSVTAGADVGVDPSTEPLS